MAESSTGAKPEPNAGDADGAGGVMALGRQLRAAAGRGDGPEVERLVAGWWQKICAPLPG